MRQEVIMYRPPRRKSELYHILMNYRYLLIRFKSGKFFVLDKTGDKVPRDIVKKLLENEKQIIFERFGKDHWVYKLISSST